MNRQSIRFRLTAWYVAVLTAGFGVFGGLIWLSMRSRLISEIDRDLAGRAERFEKFFRVESAELPGGGVLDELSEFSQALPPGSYIELSGGNGFRFRSAGVPSTTSGFRVLRRRFTFRGNAYDLETGTPLAAIAHTLDLLRFLLLSLIPLVIVIACVGGAWLSGRALKPVRDLTAAALTISIENLSGRLPVPGTGDELARLTEVLNGMLERLEGAVKTLSRFVADASHEFRTPLAVIQTTAELALRRARTPESYRGSLREIEAEVERMTHLVEDLLTLARNDTGAAEMPLAPVDVRELARDAIAEIGALAERREIRVIPSLGDRPAAVSGNRPAMRRMFLALLDNAIKYSHPGGEVTVAVESGESEVSVTFDDLGVGIRPADLPNIFQRFYRADQARSGGGYGLGLPLAESIARAHGARIAVQSIEGASSTFRVTFAARECGVVRPAVTGTASPVR